VGWAVRILRREDAASLRTQARLFFLAKDAQRGELQLQEIGVGKGSEFAGSGFDGIAVLPALANLAKSACRAFSVVG
jgi:hypothetical protein